jgi:serine/threonine protein kinase
VKFCPQCSAFYGNEANSCPEDGVELKRTHDPYLGRTIAARYRLVKRLGSGGMSTVYLAHHVMIERFSALKILREDLSRHATHRERFLREARAVNRINHPNIVEISDLGEADGVAYLVMEYVDGPSLHQEILKNGAFPWQRAVRIALQVAGALARAHQMGVIHRDLKPENILLPRRPADTALSFLGTMVPADHELVKLTDFGIAKIMDEPGLTMSEQLFGTPGYIAPEFLEGHESDPRSDLYSLGVILYEMTTGVLPYDDRGASLLTAPLRSPPIPPSQRIPAYFADLEDLVLHLLARAGEATARCVRGLRRARVPPARRGTVGPAGALDDAVGDPDLVRVAGGGAARSAHDGGAGPDRRLGGAPEADERSDGGRGGRDGPVA